MIRRLPWLVLLVCPALGEPYQLGLQAGWAGQVAPQVRRDWLSRTGCLMPRIEIRQELFLAPGGRALADADVFATVARGGSPLMILANNESRAISLPDGTPAETTEPLGLNEPVFTDGSDVGGPGRGLNPANRWAIFVGDVVERYDGDGVRDAPGSPKLTWYCFQGGSDARPESPSSDHPEAVPGWPGAAHDRLARLLFVGRAAARHADPNAKVGLRLRRSDSLPVLLSDARHPAGPLLDFIDYTAEGSTSDDVCYGRNGLAAVKLAVEGDCRKSGYLSPKLLCGQTSLSGARVDERLARAAAVKTQVVGAALRLVTVQWCGLFDPAPAPTGLLRILPGPTSNGPACQPRDAFYAYLTLARLLGEGLADGSVRYIEEVSLGGGARCHRFGRGDAEILVAWAYDAEADPERTTTVALPLRPGRSYARYRWDYALTGRADETISGRAESVPVTLGIDPEYFTDQQPPPQDEPVARPSAPAEPGWTVRASDEENGHPATHGIDGDWDTCWSSTARRPQRWWRVDFAGGPRTAREVTVKVGRCPSASMVIQVSDDGEVWRTVSKPYTSADWAPHVVVLDEQVSSARWRVLFDSPLDSGVTLYEFALGGPPWSR